MNPITSVSLAASTWIVVLGLNQMWVSVLVILVSQLVAVLRLRNLSVAAATLALTLPLGLSMVLVHSPFGQDFIIPFVSRDGLLLAAQLTLRFCALVSAFLAASCGFTVPELVKSLSFAPRLAFVVGSTVQIVPQAKDAFGAIRDANKIFGRKTRGPIKAVKNLALPLIIRLLNAGAARAIPLEVAGLDVAGRKTLLVPVNYPRVEKLLSVVAPVVAVVIICL